jgi:hypothetical protein
MPETVSVTKARHILGSLASSLSDNQVIEIIQSLQLLAREQLCYNGSKLNGVLSNELSESTNTK